MKITIENYENMTVEEKLAALEAYDPEKNGFVAKTVLDKATSEAASYKKQLREKMSEEEALKAKEAEDKAALMARVEELEREKTVNTYTTSYLAMGYDEKLAKSTAEALAKGDMNTVFANQKVHFDAREKVLRAELLKGTPAPAAGGDPKIDYTQKIQEAQASGDFTAVAYYTRLAGQEAANNNE